MAIVVNIRRSGRDAATDTQVRDAAARAWVVADEQLERHGDVVVAVARNVVRGVYDVTAWRREPTGRVEFELTASERFAAIVGGPSPVTWRKGQANPVAFVDTATLHGSGATVTKPRRLTHRIVIETQGLADDDAARLHVLFIATAKATGHLSYYTTTSLVREFKAAQEELTVPYVSAPSPKATY